MTDNPFRRLPAVHQVLETPAVRDLAGRHAPDVITEAVRQELAALRQRIVSGETEAGTDHLHELGKRVQQRLAREDRPYLRTVINATGIILHTNLGRAPLPEAAAQAAYQAARQYLNLELSLESGQRSSRQIPIRRILAQLLGAESATAVNNNAAATVLVLRALCAGKEVIVSRGQLIEIGGSFRIPEIMAVSGAILREVGTTNITRLSDFECAIGPNTAALLQVHTSNYRVSGFTEAVSTAELVTLGRKHQLLVLDDVGSGALLDFQRFGFTGEPLARESLRQGADLVLFSGDKLLGGPQAGLIAGRTELIQKIEQDPLMRAFRLDKMTLAALEATLRIYLDERRALQEIPILRMLSCSKQELRKRAESLAERLRQLPGIASIRVVEDVAYVGGGSLPDQAVPGIVLEVKAKVLSEAVLAQRLRVGEPAVMSRLRAERLIFDVRTVFPEQEEPLLAAVQAALHASHSDP